MEADMRIVYMGTAEFSVPSFKALHEAVGVAMLITQPDRPAGRRLRLHPSPAKEAAAQMGIEVYQPERIKDPQVLERLAALAPDIIWVAAYGQILPRALLELPSMGAVNLHGSYLPAYRGAAPIQRAIMNGESSTGVSTLFMTPKVDAGDVILQRRVPVSEDDTSLTLGRRLAEEGAEIVLETTAILMEGRARALSLPQDDSLATFAPVIRREEACIDWEDAGWKISNLIRAMIPAPVSYTCRGHERIKVWCARYRPGRRNEKPGTLLSTTADGIDIAAGEGSVLISALQPENRKRMQAAEFISGYRPVAGEVWGSSSY